MLGMWPQAARSARKAARVSPVWPWLAQGRVKPVIHSVFPALQAEGQLPSGAARAHATGPPPGRRARCTPDRR